MTRENKKQLISRAATCLFYAKGFNAATTAEIALKAGVSEGAIFRYYKIKKEKPIIMPASSPKDIEEIIDRTIDMFMHGILNHAPDNTP